MLVGKQLSIDQLNNLMLMENGCEYSDLLDGKVEKISSSNCEPLNVLHLNIRGFRKNVEALTMLLADLENKGVVVHVIAVCETFLSKQSADMANIENYLPVHRYREDRMGGGTSLFLHDSVKLLKPVPSPQNDSFESACVEATYKGKSICICEVYRPPNSDIENYLHDLDNLINRMNFGYLNVICGDFNLNLLNAHSHKQMGKMLSNMLDNGFIPYIVKPTRVTHSTCTLIDNIYVKSSSLSKNLSFVITDSMSDHYPCLLSYSLSKEKVKSDYLIMEKRKLTEESIGLLQQKLLFQDWSYLSNPVLTVDKSYLYLNTVITKALDDCIPKKLVKIKGDDKFNEPWLTVGIKKCNSKSRHLCNKARNSGVETDLIRYKNYRNSLNRIKLYAKRKHYKGLFEKIGKNSKLMVLMVFYGSVIIS